MPQTAEHHGGHQVGVGSQVALAVAAKGNIKVVA